VRCYSLKEAHSDKNERPHLRDPSSADARERQGPTLQASHAVCNGTAQPHTG
jgi:hypothetical protein